MMLDIIVPGNQVGKARPRFNGAVVYTPSITRDYEQLVAITYCRKYILGTNTFKATLIFAQTVGKDWIGVGIKK